jgi:tRNA dimethylallyltransferase
MFHYMQSKSKFADYQLSNILLITAEKKYNLLVILGPTASGKTRFAAKLARELDGEIISADSRQVYRRMDIGTGKDYNDYIVDGIKIPVHLIDIHEPGYKYNVFEYQKDFFCVFKEINNKNKLPILCGGTGMYIEAVTKGYKLISVPVNEKLRSNLEGKSLYELAEVLSSYKKLHNKSDTDTIKRAVRAIEIEEYCLAHPEHNYSVPEIKPLFIGVKYDREKRRERITTRLKQRLENGMVEEVESLLREGIKPEDLIYYGLEYKFITQFLKKEITHEAMEYHLNIAIHQFAKRQMTWFRKMEKNGSDINWLNGELNISEKISKSIAILSGNKE